MLFLAILLYLAADLALPSISGAFGFDPNDSIEPVQCHRLRAVPDVVAMPALAPEPFAPSAPRIDRLPRPARTGSASVAPQAASHLARAALDSASRSADDTH